jgi:hypothetical protein
MGYARGKVEHEMTLSDRKEHRMAEQMECKIYARLLPLARGLTGLADVPTHPAGYPQLIRQVAPLTRWRRAQAGDSGDASSPWVEWHDRRPAACWRGASTGLPRPLTGASWPRNQRVMLTNMSVTQARELKVTRPPALTPESPIWSLRSG